MKAEEKYRRKDYRHKACLPKRKLKPVIDQPTWSTKRKRQEEENNINAKKEDS